MTRTLATTVAAALLFAAPALAQDKPADAPSKKQAVQQQRMKSCNDQAGKKDLKGRERQAFMSECLSAKGKGGGKMNAQQARMKSCNAQAAKRDLKGDERQAFMSRCLKGKA